MAHCIHVHDTVFGVEEKAHDVSIGTEAFRPEPGVRAVVLVGAFGSFFVARRPLVTSNSKTCLSSVTDWSWRF